MRHSRCYGPIYAVPQAKLELRFRRNGDGKITWNIVGEWKLLLEIVIIVWGSVSEASPADHRLNSTSS
jgi:hypothetical protein